MKINHRVGLRNLGRLTSGELAGTQIVLDAHYQAEVDQSVSRGEERYRQAEQRLRRAEAKAERLAAQSVRRSDKKAHAKLEADAWALVELRRTELAEITRLMQSSPQSGKHRGVKSEPRPVPITMGVNL